MFNLSLLVVLVVLAIGFVRWGGEQTRETLRTRANIAYYVVVFIALVSCWITIQNRKHK